jgi:hypothetical protein
MKGFMMDPNIVNKEVLSMLHKVGLTPQSKPSEEAPELPTELSEVPLKDLSYFLQAFTSWAGYASGLEAIAKNEVAIYEAQLEYTGAIQYMRATGNVTERREAKLTNEEYLKIRDLLLQSKARYELLKVTRERMTKYAEVISRQITIIQLEQKTV